ncbi:hypothetical protein [Edaphocola flava]|jgi:hypothetical protein|uniref:hypothetical protein n=1 Tax=Edaphocola flava TaxID=2499629 RepID=UPI00100BF26E|nr:hypothetical protein [Edaphocola flava]
MKKILLSALILLPFTLSAQNRKEEKAFKKSYINACVNSATKEGTISEKLAKEYCNCTLERLLKKYSYEDLAVIGENLDAEQMKKLLDDTLPCQEELARKLKAKKD